MGAPDLLSRRQALSALAAPATLVAAGVGLAPPSAVPDPDHELVRLFDLWKAKSQALEGVNGRSDEELERLVDELNAIEFEVYRTPAASLRGLQVKADLAAEYMHLEDDGTLDSAALNSLLSAIKALAGVPLLPGAVT